MEEEPKIFYNKLLKRSSGDKKYFIYIQTKWSKNSVDFVLQESQGNHCYKGILPVKDIAETASEFGKEFEEFYDECHNAITANIALPNFEYEVCENNDEETAVFKLIKKDPFEIFYITATLKKLNNSCEIHENALSLIESYKNEAGSSTRNDQNYQELLEAYQQCVEEKKLIKRQMLKKVALLLNCKKRKIAELIQNGVVVDERIESNNEKKEDVDITVVGNRDDHDDDDVTFNAATQMINLEEEMEAAYCSKENGVDQYDDSTEEEV